MTPGAVRDWSGQHPGQMNGPSNSDADDEAPTWSSTWVGLAGGFQLVSVLKTSSAARDLYTTPRKRAAPPPPPPQNQGLVLYKSGAKTKNFMRSLTISLVSPSDR